ncbi:hypothetical protein PR048_004150 [Dryococelus australis]|uniref:Uncharacterized protein n=1 Tax=Dryococelus australis TaxID=614101 RepID=A0ABQ9I547_9NEOP|nr:hypothetical protein PR048_004150 [Dryococelus australis]
MLASEGERVIKSRGFGDFVRHPGAARDDYSDLRECVASASLCAVKSGTEDCMLPVNLRNSQRVKDKLNFIRVYHRVSLLLDHRLLETRPNRLSTNKEAVGKTRTESLAAWSVVKLEQRPTKAKSYWPWLHRPRLLYCVVYYWLAVGQWSRALTVHQVSLQRWTILQSIVPIFRVITRCTAKFSSKCQLFYVSRILNLATNKLKSPDLMKKSSSSQRVIQGVPGSCNGSFHAVTMRFSLSLPPPPPSSYPIHVVLLMVVSAEKTSGMLGYAEWLLSDSRAHSTPLSLIWSVSRGCKERDGSVSTALSRWKQVYVCSRWLFMSEVGGWGRYLTPLSYVSQLSAFQLQITSRVRNYISAEGYFSEVSPVAEALRSNSPTCQPYSSLLETRSRRFLFRWSLLSLLVFYRSELSYSFSHQLLSSDASHTYSIVRPDHLEGPAAHAAKITIVSALFLYQIRGHRPIARVFTQNNPFLSAAAIIQLLSFTSTRSRGMRSSEHSPISTTAATPVLLVSVLELIVVLLVRYHTVHYPVPYSVHYWPAVSECRAEPVLTQSNDKIDFKRGPRWRNGFTRSPPTKANRIQSPAGSPDFRMWESCRMMPLVRGLSRGISRFPRPPHSGAAPYSPRSPSLAPKTSLLRAAQISSLARLQTHDKIDVKHVYTEVDFAIGSQFIEHALVDSEPIADLQGNNSMACGIYSSHYILESQVFVHWLLPHRVASVTSHLAVWHSLLVSSQVCHWLRVVQGVSNELRSNCKVNFSVHWTGVSQKGLGIRERFTLRLPPAGTAVAERIDYSPPPQGEPGSIPGGVTGFSHVGIVPDDAVGRRVFSGISRFPRPFVPAPLHIHSNQSHLLSRHRSDVVVLERLVQVCLLDVDVTQLRSSMEPAGCYKHMCLTHSNPDPVRLCGRRALYPLSHLGPLRKLRTPAKPEGSLAKTPGDSPWRTDETRSHHKCRGGDAPEKKRTLYTRGIMWQTCDVLVTSRFFPRGARVFLDTHS